MSVGLSKSDKRKLWDKWIRQPVYLDDGVYNIVPRYNMVKYFLQKALIPFVESKGYLFSKNFEGLYTSLLQYMFALYLDQKVRFKPAHEGVAQEHVDEFDYRFDSLEIEEFWEKWGSIEDFRMDGYASEIRYTLSSFIWVNLDLDRSPRVIQLSNLLRELDEAEQTDYGKKDPKGKDDPYLQDASRFTEDRRWY